MKVGQVFYFNAPHHKIKELCETVLVNTLLYDYEIEEVRKGFF
jgi:phosphoribosylformylglycinamidine (FGAM) synthase PurS component